MIRVKYIESNSDAGSEAASVEREMLVDINCPIKTTLDYIRKVARLSSTCEFDLCDEVNCQLKNVSLYKPTTRGTDVLQPDLTYYIVTFERDEKGQMINLTPLLTAKDAKKCQNTLTKLRKPPQTKYND